jgi:membrane dipeptidase
MIIDAHEDLAWNILTFGRDYTQSAYETRRKEAGGFAPSVNGDTLLGWPEYQRARVGIVFATLFAAPARRSDGEWDRQCYRDTQEARRVYQAQADVYARLTDEHPNHFRLLRSQGELAAHCRQWQSDTVKEPPVGLVLSMEGAEAIGSPSELEIWWGAGVRLIGPAWAGTRFCGGTREPGPLTKDGFELLEAMAGFGFGLDLSHMDEAAARQALDVYPGPIIVSHGNALALLKNSDSNRHLSDHVIHGVIERDGVIGIVPYNVFLSDSWQRGDPRQRVTLQQVVAQVDYICQLAGDARHVGIGSDFDGGFGVQSVPIDLDTIADLVKLGPILAEKGYSEQDVDAILGTNWLNLLQKALPAGL